MIMGEKSVSVVLNSDDGFFNPKILEVWLKVLRGYRYGAELILVSFNEDDTVQYAFQERHAEDGVKIVSIVSDKPPNWVNLMKEAHYYIDGEYVWYSASYTYPNGDILSALSGKLNHGTLLILKGTYIKEVFDYSTMTPLTREKEDYFEPPCIDIESFFIQSRAFKDFSALQLQQGINGSYVARAWSELLGISYEYDDKAAVFIVQN